MNMISDNLTYQYLTEASISIFDRGINICCDIFETFPSCFSRQSMKLNHWQIDIKSQALQIFTTKEIFRNIRLRCSGIIVETTIIELSRRQNDWQKIIGQRLILKVESQTWGRRGKNILENEKILEPAGILPNETQVSPFLLTSRKREILEPERNGDSLPHKCGSKQSKNSSDWVRRWLEDLLTV